MPKKSNLVIGTVVVCPKIINNRNFFGPISGLAGQKVIIDMKTREPVMVKGQIIGERVKVVPLSSPKSTPVSIMTRYLQSDHPDFKKEK